MLTRDGMGVRSHLWVNKLGRVWGGRRKEKRPGEKLESVCIYKPGRETRPGRIQNCWKDHWVWQHSNVGRLGRGTFLLKETGPWRN